MLYAFKKDPKELFPPEKSNFTAARHQTEKNFQKNFYKKDGLREIQNMFDCGIAEGNFLIVSNEEATQI